MMPFSLRWTTLAVLAGSVVLAGAIAGQGDPKAQQGEFTQKPKTPQEFVQFASETDLAEINLGRLAAQRGGSAAVKKFGDQMVTDHSKSNAKLLQIANKKQLRPASEMDAKHRELADKLAKMNADEFDRTYMTEMVKGHKMVAGVFQAQAESGTDTDLKNFAAEIVPTIRQHLQMAEQISGQLKGGAGKAGGTTDR
jgi:putative membrane protein